MSDNKYLCESCEYKLHVFLDRGTVECASLNYVRERTLKKKSCVQLKVYKKPPNCNDEEFQKQAKAVLLIANGDDDIEIKMATISYYLFCKARHYYKRGKMNNKPVDTTP